MITCILYYLLVLSNATTGNTGDSAISIKPHWQKGEIKKYEITQKVKISFNSTTIVSDISLTVKDINSDFITLEWRYDTVKIFDSLMENPGNRNKPILQLILDHKTIRYRSDPEGNIKEILNFPELSKQLKASVDSLTPAFMQSMVPNIFANFLLKDLLFFHQLYGKKLRTGDTTILSRKYSISPDIDLPSVSNKVTLTATGIIKGFWKPEGLPLSMDPKKVISNFTYEFLPGTFWLRRYESILVTPVPDGYVTNEYEIILLP